MACQFPGPVPPDPPSEWVWPPAPEAARIRYVTGISGPHDLGIGTGVWQRFYRYLAGRQQPVLVAPFTVRVDDQGRIYTVDSFLRKIHRFDPGARKYLLFPRENELLSPVDLAVDTAGGRIYVTDSRQGVVKIYSLAGESMGREIGKAVLERPTGIALNPVSGELLVVDTRKSLIYRFNPGNGQLLGTMGSPGTGPGMLHFPTHIGIDAGGAVYVTDAMNFRIQVYSDQGRILGGFGQAGDGRGRFARPRGVAVDSRGRIYVVDALFDNIQIFDRQFRLLMALGRPGQAPGQFWLPAGIHIDARDRIYVADTYNKRIQIFELLASQDNQP